MGPRSLRDRCPNRCTGDSCRAAKTASQLFWDREEAVPRASALGDELSYRRPSSARKTVTEAHGEKERETPPCAASCLNFLLW